MQERKEVYKFSKSTLEEVRATRYPCQGKPIIAVMHLNMKEKRLGLNAMARFYGRGNAEGRLRYLDKGKAQRWANTGGLQSPRVMAGNVGTSKSTVLFEA